MAEETLLKLGENCCAVSRTGRFALLVDGAAYFDAFRRAAERAERSITILAWDFDSRTPLAWNDEKASLTLGDFLNALARRRRGLEVRVLDWDYPLLYGLDREMRPLYGLGWKPHRRVHVRYDGSHPLVASQHQKIVLIDDRIAFVGGLDLASRRWDTPDHKPDDPRRVVTGQDYPPFHDVMALVDGEAAGQLAKIVRAPAWKPTLGPPTCLPTSRMSGSASLAPRPRPTSSRARERSSDSMST